MCAATLAALLLGVTGSACAAQTVTSAATGDSAISRAEPVIAALRAEGYTIVSVSTTWLNRVRIRASNAVLLREIIVSPSTGAILRDAVVTRYVAQPDTAPESRSFEPLVPDPMLPGAGE